MKAIDFVFPNRCLEIVGEKCNGKSVGTMAFWYTETPKRDALAYGNRCISQWITCQRHGIKAGLKTCLNRSATRSQRHS